jgi:hypothetical protein
MMIKANNEGKAELDKLFLHAISRVKASVRKPHLGLSVACLPGNYNIPTLVEVRQFTL